MASRFFTSLPVQSKYFKMNSFVGRRAMSTTQDKPVTLARFFEQQVQKYEHRDLLRSANDDLRFTFSELHLRVHALGNGLQNIFFKPGRKLLFTLDHSPDHVIFQLATSGLGVQLISTTPDPNPGVVGKYFEKFQPHGVVLNSRVYNEKVLLQLFPELDWLNLDLNFYSEKYPYLKHILRTDQSKIHGTLQIQCLLQYNRVPNEYLALVNKSSADSPVIYSSIEGDQVQDQNSFTGLNILSVGKSVHEKLGLAEDRVCVAYPFYKPLGHAVGIWSCISSASTIVLPSSLTTDQIFSTVTNDHCNVIIASPALLANLKPNHQEALKKINKILLVDPQTPDSLVEGLKKQGVKTVHSFNTTSKTFN